MKRLLRTSALSAAIAIIGLGSASALDARNTWRGGILITSVTAACNQPGYPSKGKTLLAVFRPRFVNTAPKTAFLVSFANGSLLVTPTSTTIPTPSSGSYSGLVIGGLATGNAYSGGTYSITTNNFNANTPQINISGTITKFRNTAGCTVTFKGGLIRGVV